jgi:hypothetical protein
MGNAKCIQRINKSWIASEQDEKTFHPFQEGESQKAERGPSDWTRLKPYIMPTKGIDIRMTN